MSVDLRRPRPDIVYIKRRLKVGETVPVVDVPASNVSSLMLGAPVEAVKPSVASVPYVGVDNVLKGHLRALRLPAVKSGVGVLEVKNVAYAGWHDVNNRSGFLYRNVPAGSVDTFERVPFVKNRAVAEFVEPDFVVSLRNLRFLRRLLLVPQVNETMVLRNVGGMEVVVPYENDTIVYLSVVDLCLEIRRVRCKTGEVHTMFRLGHGVEKV